MSVASSMSLDWIGLENGYGTRFDPDVGPSASLPRDVPRACCRLVQWLAACIHHLRDRLHGTLHLPDQCSGPAPMGVVHRAGGLYRREFLRMGDPPLRDAPALADQGFPRHLQS